MKCVGQALVLLIAAAAPAYAAGSPVLTPEPATIGLVATGIGAIGAFALWRKRRR